MKPNNPAPGPAPGPTESDNLCKRLAELYPEQFAQWLFGVSDVAVQKTELSREPLRADAVIFAHQDAETLHVEFQTTHHSEVPLPLRMLDYYVGLKRQNPQQRVRQVLVLLKRTKTPIPEQYTDERTVHGYEVVKLWAVEPAEIMQYQ
jgi:predicted transposase YdaD